MISKIKKKVNLKAININIKTISEILQSKEKINTKYLNLLYNLCCINEDNRNYFLMISTRETAR